MSLGGQASIRYKELVEDICDELGEAYEDLSDAARQRLRRGVQKALEKIWDFAVWPHLRAFSERSYHPAYDAAESVSTGDIRLYGASYWQALSSGVLDTPSAESADWQAYTLTQRLIPYMEGADEIGIVKAVRTFDPRVTDCGQLLSYTLAREGIYLRSEAPATVWVEHMPPVPTLDGADWDEETTYAAGERVYYEAAGDFFTALEETTGDVPGESPAQWERVSLPPLFKAFLVWSAVARSLGGDGQTRERKAAQMDAEEALLRAFDIAYMMTGTQQQAITGTGHR